MFSLAMSLASVLCAELLRAGLTLTVEIGVIILKLYHISTENESGFLILFENISSEEQFESSLKDEITQAISTWMPYLVIQELIVNINMGEDGRVDDPTHAVGITLNVSITGTNIYLPIRIFISDTGNLTIEEAIYNG